MLQYSLVIIVGIIWGFTNPFLEKGTQKVKSNDRDMSFRNLLNSFSKSSIMLPFLANQLGSVLNVYALSKVELSIGNMLANSTSIATTFIVQNLIVDRKTPSLNSMIGISLILLGVLISI